MTRPTLTRSEFDTRRARAAKSRWLRNALSGWRDPALNLAGAGMTWRQWLTGAAAVAIASAIIAMIYLAVPTQ